MRFSRFKETIQGWRHRAALPWVAGAVAFGCVWGALTLQEQSHPDREEAVPVWVAVRYVPRGRPVRAADFRRESVPRVFRQPGAVVPGMAWEGESGRALYRSAVPLLEGMQMTRELLAQTGQGRGLSSLIPERMVAVSFAVDPARGLAGLVEPGDLVNILAAPAPNLGGRPDSGVRVLFQAVSVLAVGKRMEAQPAERSSPGGSVEEGTILTVAVNPRAAVVLTEARESRVLCVALRAPGDDSVLEEIP